MDFRNKKLAGTTTACCEIAIAQNNTRPREKIIEKVANSTVEDAFRSSPRYML